jgi:hypothetical protein
MILSGIYTDFSDKTREPSVLFQVDDDQKGYEFEAQHAISGRLLTFTTGAGFYRLDQDLTASAGNFFAGKGPPKIEESNLYSYVGIRYPQPVNWLLGFIMG